jgi:ribosomal protein L37AE/L43A
LREDQRSRIDASDLERARDADLLTTAQALGAVLKRRSTRSEWEGPCLLCGGTDRFAINIQKKVWNCRGCDDGGNDAISLVMHARELDFRRAVEWLTGERQELKRQHAPEAGATAPKPTDDSEARSNLRSAARIVTKLVAIRGTPGEAYLAEARKIDTDAVADVLERTDALGWHPSVYFNEPGHPLHGQKLGCIIGVMSDPVTAEPTGAISRTYLEGRKISKAKTLGSPAGIIRLTPDEDVLGGLHIAEGIETALTGMSKGLRPMWATGSTSIMTRFPLLSGIEALTIVADNDANNAGQHACEACAARWHAAGREVFIIEPTIGKDLNDAIRLWNAP